MQYSELGGEVKMIRGIINAMVNMVQGKIESVKIDNRVHAMATKLNCRICGFYHEGNCEEFLKGLRPGS